ncbi:MAG: Ldh family oxidoreductase [Betaproteobacteria bacterium]|nr:Ldh family oxidoreductase [Betaproteobacteria bacterium]
MTAATVALSLAEVGELSLRALLNSNVSRANAGSVAASIVAAEAEGIHSHGLMRLPTYCDHARCGKVNGNAVPTATVTAPGALVVDARDGFAHPAIDLGLKDFGALVRKNGIAAMAVTNSYNCGVVGYHVGRVAAEGLVCLAYVNTPAAIAPWGGAKALFGTNPIAFAAPRRNGAPVVIDQSSSVVARGEVMLKAQQGLPIPEGWAFDKDGKPTTDPNASLKGGSMAPAGGYKGAGIALMVEVMAAVLTGANFSFAASSFANNEGGPPRTGQFFIGLDPAAFAGARFPDRIEELCTAILTQPGARLPGARRLAARERTAGEGVVISGKLYDDLVARAG